MFSQLAHLNDFFCFMITFSIIFQINSQNKGTFERDYVSFLRVIVGMGSVGAYAPTDF